MNSENQNNTNQLIDVTEQNTLFNKQDSKVEQVYECNKDLYIQTSANSFSMSKDIILDAALENIEKEYVPIENNNNIEKTDTEEKIEASMNKQKELSKCYKRDDTIIIESKNMLSKKIKETEEISEKNCSFVSDNEKTDNEKTDNDHNTDNGNHLHCSEQTLNGYVGLKYIRNEIKENDEEEKEMETAKINVQMNNIELILPKQESNINHLKKEESPVLVNEPEKYFIYEEKESETSYNHEKQLECDFFNDDFELEKIFLSKENLIYIEHLKDDESYTNNTNNSNNLNKEKKVECYKLNSNTECSASLDSSGKAMYENDYDIISKGNSDEFSKENSFISVLPEITSNVINHSRATIPKLVYSGNIVVTSKKPSISSIEQNIETENQCNSTITCAEFYKTCNLFPFRKRLTPSKQTQLMNMKNESDDNIKKIPNTMDTVTYIHSATKQLKSCSENHILHQTHVLNNENINTNERLPNTIHVYGSYQFPKNPTNNFNSEHSVELHKAHNVCKNKATCKKGDDIISTCQFLNYKGIYNKCANFVEHIKCTFFFCLPNKEQLNELMDDQNVFLNNCMNETLYVIDNRKLIAVPQSEDAINKKNNNIVEVITRRVSNNGTLEGLKNVQTIYQTVDTEINNQTEIHNSYEPNNTNEIISYFTPSKRVNTFIKTSNNINNPVATSDNKVIVYTDVLGEKKCTSSTNNIVKENIEITPTTEQIIFKDNKTVLHNSQSSLNEKTQNEKTNVNKMREIVSYFENIMNKNKNTVNRNLKKNIETSNVTQTKRTNLNEQTILKNSHKECSLKEANDNNNVVSTKNRITANYNFCINCISACSKVTKTPTKENDNASCCHVGRPAAIKVPQINTDSITFLNYREIVTDQSLIDSLNRLSNHQVDDNVNHFINSVNETNMCVGVPHIHYG